MMELGNDSNRNNNHNPAIHTDDGHLRSMDSDNRDDDDEEEDGQIDENEDHASAKNDPPNGSIAVAMQSKPSIALMSAPSVSTSACPMHNGDGMRDVVDLADGWKSKDATPLPTAAIDARSSDVSDQHHHQQQQQQQHILGVHPGSSEQQQQHQPTPKANDEKDPQVDYHPASRPAAAATSASPSTQLLLHAHAAAQHFIYGVPTLVQAAGSFPNVGSVLGPFFCLGRLGKGTFSSIHKCINLHFYHQQAPPARNDQGSAAHDGQRTQRQQRRFAAAKVELSTFQQSGVLEAEATILDYLYQVLPDGTVPVYMGHYKSEKFAAIMMEYLPGEDMHQLREKIMAGSASRRIETADAVYLTANILLPLLERMHDVGVVHRDVKPSNCVRAGSSGSAKSRDFCLVDFGLSKSIVVPENSEWADPDHPWNGKNWLRPLPSPSLVTKSESTLETGTTGGCFRKERPKADFRGTSMYASLRVHQLRDYCPRDDVWSLLYVFCDLVSGGLPWMSHAANRDRTMCQVLKERVHGEAKTNPSHDADGKHEKSNTDNGGDEHPSSANNTNLQPDETAQLLMGDEYHVALFRREREKAPIQASGNSNGKIITIVPDPLAMSNDQVKVGLLRRAFQHLASLQFWDRPNYQLIQECLLGFLVDNSVPRDPPIPCIAWEDDDDDDDDINEDINGTSPNHRRSKKRRRSTPGVVWSLRDEDGNCSVDLLGDDIFENIVTDGEIETDVATNNDVDEQRQFMSRLPLEVQFRIAQMEYNATPHHKISLSRHRHHPDDGTEVVPEGDEKVPPSRALNDWMWVVQYLLYQNWDSRRYEDGGHRTSTDGYQRDRYYQLLLKCRHCAEQHDYFRSIQALYYRRRPSSENGPGAHPIADHASSNGDERHTDSNDLRLLQKRGIDMLCTPSVPSGSLSSADVTTTSNLDLVHVSKALFGLEAAIKAENAKKPAPPMRISFS